MTEYDGNQMELTQLSGGGWPGTAVGDAQALGSDPIKKIKFFRRL